MSERSSIINDQTSQAKTLYRRQSSFTVRNEDLRRWFMVN